MSGFAGQVILDATVRRTKENYGIICVAKLKELPPQSIDWMNTRNRHLDGRTPQEVIEVGDGHLAEELVERLVHMHEGFTALANVYQRYADVPELETMWQTFKRAWLNYEGIIQHRFIMAD